RITEDHPVAAHPQATVALERGVQRLDVALLLRQLPEGTAQTAPRVGWKAPHKLDHLQREFDLHSSARLRARSGTKRSRPARWSSMAFLAAGLASISIVSTIASR